MLNAEKKYAFIIKILNKNLDEELLKKFSTIENEKNNNPRLQVNSKEEYAEIMNNLNLANPKMMDVAVPANLKGLTLDQI